MKGLNLDGQIWSGFELKVKELVLANGGTEAYEAIKDEDLKPNLASMALRNLLWLKKLDVSSYYDAIFDAMAIMIRRQSNLFSRWSPNLEVQLKKSTNLDWAATATEASKFWSYYKIVFHRVFGEVRRDFMKRLERDTQLNVFNDESLDDALDSLTSTTTTSTVEDDAIYDNLVSTIKSKLSTVAIPNSLSLSAKGVDNFNDVCVAIFDQLLLGGYSRAGILDAFDVPAANVSKIYKSLMSDILPDILVDLDLDISFLNDF